MAGGAHIDIFSAAAKLRDDASAKSRIADFSFRAFLTFALIGGGLFALAALMFGVGTILDLIIHSISIVPGN